MTINCRCGSGEPREELFDGHGIHLCFVCTQCRKQKLAKFRPDIFERYQCDEPIEAEEYR